MEREEGKERIGGRKGRFLGLPLIVLYDYVFCIICTCIVHMYIEWNGVEDFFPRSVALSLLAITRYINIGNICNYIQLLGFDSTVHTYIHT